MRRSIRLLWPLLALLTGSCLGTLRHDSLLEAVVLAPSPVLGLPVREQRTRWLLRGEPGWCASEEVRFGGDPGDAAVLTVRAVRLPTVDSARAARARLTPEYLYLTLRDRMVWPPRAVAYPLPLPGDEPAALEYGVRLPPELAGVELAGQLTVLRAGQVVLLVESIGVRPEVLVPALEELVQAAGSVPPGCHSDERTAPHGGGSERDQAIIGVGQKSMQSRQRLFT